MRSRNTITLSITTITVHALDRVVSLTTSSRMRCTQRIVNQWHSKLVLVYSLVSWLTRSKEVVALWILWLTSIWYEICSQHGAREVFCDLDFDIAKIPFSSCSLSLLLVWVIRFRCAWWSALEATIPVVRDEWLPLVPLGRTMGVDIVHMWKVCLESVHMKSASV
jgi:hypothetical protein